uniref:LITAF domain-containing protein n=1 Tax=Strongyloides papillosus TaxID=174720 RepID=A0A0N5CFU6_STREA
MSKDNHSPPPPYPGLSSYETKINMPPTFGDTPNSQPYNQQFPPPPNISSNPPNQQQPTATSGAGAPPIVLRLAKFGPLPIETDCQFCNAHIVTKTHNVTGSLPYIVATVLFILGFFFIFPFFCICLPFCVDMFLDTIHECPNCHKEVGRFKRM